MRKYTFHSLGITTMHFAHTNPCSPIAPKRLFKSACACFSNDCFGGCSGHRSEGAPSAHFRPSSSADALLTSDGVSAILHADLAVDSLNSQDKKLDPLGKLTIAAKLEMHLNSDDEDGVFRECI
jgi:hypothetical protein